MIRERLKNGAGAVVTVLQQNGKGVPQRTNAEILLAGMAVDAIKKCGHVQQLVAHLDEMEIQQVFLVRHGGTFGAPTAAVNRQEPSNAHRLAITSTVKPLR